MARGPDDGSESDDAPILSPDELDISQDEHVAEIEEGRYVVSPNDPISDVPTKDETSEQDSSREAQSGEMPEPDGTESGLPDSSTASAAEAADLTEEDVHDWLETRFEDTNSRYGFDVTAKFDGTVEQRYMVSNDVVTIFESLTLWYAQQIDSSTPVEEVLGILLMESNVPIRYPASGLKQLLESTDLSPEDSIADLVAAVDEDDGFRL